MGVKEARFQAALIRDLRLMFPGCMVLKNDTGYLQGVPDLLLLVGKQWAMLECKKHEGADMQPNQQYWVNELNSMSFASFIYPENREEVLDALQQAFGTRRSTRVSGRQ